MRCNSLFIFTIILSALSFFASASLPANNAQQRQTPFNPKSSTFEMDNGKPFLFDSDKTGPPELSDVIAREKSASIALDSILRSESLMRALSGDTYSELTVLLPTNKAFIELGEIPDNVEQLMKRHFVPKVVTPHMMEEGLTLYSLERAMVLRFSAMHGKAYVQPGTGKPVEVGGEGTKANNGLYYLVDEVFV